MLGRTLVGCALLVSTLAAPWSSSIRFGGGESCRRAQEARASFAPDPYSQEIFFAVLEGAYEDGLANSTADAILTLDESTNWPANFVYSCPICMPAFDALMTYRARAPLSGKKLPRDTWGAGLPDDVRWAIEQPDLSMRQRAIQDLVQSWMERRMKKLRLDESERASWQHEMEDRRKRGMAQLADYRRAKLGQSYAQMKECPFCEAANGACKLR